MQSPGHAASGKACQDAHQARVLAGGTLLLAVADGAGSAEFSAEGAQRAVSEGISSLAIALAGGAPRQEHEWRELMGSAFAGAGAAVAALARARGASVRSFATTLLLLAAGDDWLSVAEVGDGLVVAQEDGDSLALLSGPRRGEYANETSFLNSGAPEEELEILWCRRPVRALAASTDGLLRLALTLPRQEPFAPFFSPLFRFVREAGDLDIAQRNLVSFLDSERIRRRTDDDKTLVIAVRGTAVEQPGSRLLLPRGQGMGGT